MIRFLADEDLNNRIVRGLRHRLRRIDIVRAQDVDLVSAADEEVLAWAAQSDRVLLSHDASTITAAAYARIAGCKPMPGVIIIPQSLSMGAAIEDLIIVAECSVSEDWMNQVRFLPLA